MLSQSSPSDQDNFSSLAKKITFEKTQDCVRCGLCLPHCPTFQLKKDERYSPRGRIMMMQAYSHSELDLSQADEYLSTCLTCLNCQSICPAEVDYQSLIHQFQVEKNANFANQRVKIFTSILTHPFGNRLLLIFSRLLRFFQPRFLAQFFKPSLIKTALHSSMLVDFVKPRRVKRKGLLFNKQQLTSEPTIVLFAGCSAGFNQSLLDKANFLLSKLGLKVEKMTDFACCGALSFHQGDEKKALKSQNHLISKFKNHSLVLILQSGCISHIQSKGYKQEIETKEGVKIEYQDLSSFFYQQLKVSNAKFRKWQFGKVLLHLPCTQRYPLQAGVVLELMQRIEGLDTKIIDWGCCGSAGSHLFSKPVESEQLGEQMLTEIEKKLKLKLPDFDYLITTNVGCKIQFNQILAANKATQSIKIVHPIEIFADLIEL